MKIPHADLIERLRRATGDAATAQLLEAAANRIAELEAKVEGYRLSSIEQWRRKKEWQARCSDLYAQGERQPCCHTYSVIKLDGNGMPRAVCRDCGHNHA